MNQWIAYCGLDCESCDARMATVRQDEALRKQVAEQWSKLNGVEITPDMIRCEGCRMDGAKTPYCASLCPIRQCAVNRKADTCGICGEKDGCEALLPIIRNHPDAANNLRKLYTLPEAATE